MFQRDTVVMDVAAKPVVRQPVWILRTNIPLLGMGTPNVQAEWSLDYRDRWSVNVEAVSSWWTFSYNAYANEILYGSVEMRRWLGRRYRRHTLDGWHIGLGIGGGYGDVEWRSKGYQAEVFSGFVNIGWQCRFGRRRQWAFDAGIGLGYAYIPWRRYTGSSRYPVGKEEQHDDHLMWQETRRTNWVGATHVNISIGYVFNQRDAAWKRQKARERHAERNGVLHFRDSVKAREVYEHDSTMTARKLRLKEIGLLPKAERKQALQEMAAIEKQARHDQKQARRQEKIEFKKLKEQEKAAKKARKQSFKDEKDIHRQQLQEERQWENSTEGRVASQQTKDAERLARDQSRRQAKELKRQAKADKKEQRMRARIEAEQRRNREKLQRQMEKADYKYNVK